MKNLLTAAIFLVFAALICGVAFMGCEKEGPAGPAGVDGNATCGSCHNVSTVVLAKQMQYETSVHATGTLYARGTSASCTMCHSSEGFREKIAGNAATAKTDVTPVNCRTCHNIHTNYDETDYALATTTPVELTGIMYDGTTIDIGKGNLCANCHQTRLYDYGLEVGGDAEIEIVSHYGPHHGTQANYLTGNGGFEVAGSIEYTNSNHASLPDGCVTCHMYKDNHTFVPNKNACVACHSDLTSIATFRGVQDEIQGLMDDLASALIAEGLIVEEDGEYDEVVGAKTTNDKAGALLNFLGLIDDSSLGIHNTKYIRAILTNSIEVFE